MEPTATFSVKKCLGKEKLDCCSILFKIDLYLSKYPRYKSVKLCNDFETECWGGNNILIFSKGNERDHESIYSKHWLFWDTNLLISYQKYKFTEVPTGWSCNMKHQSSCSNSQHLSNIFMQMFHIYRLFVFMRVIFQLVSDLSHYRCLNLMYDTHGNVYSILSIMFVATNVSLVPDWSIVVDGPLACRLH